MCLALQNLLGGENSGKSKYQCISYLLLNNNITTNQQLKLTHLLLQFLWVKSMGMTLLNPLLTVSQDCKQVVSKGFGLIRDSTGGRSTSKLNLVVGRIQMIRLGSCNCINKICARAHDRHQALRLYICQARVLPLRCTQGRQIL